MVYYVRIPGDHPVPPRPARAYHIQRPEFHKRLHFAIRSCKETLKHSLICLYPRGARTNPSIVSLTDRLSSGCSSRKSSMQLPRWLLERGSIGGSS